MIPRTEASIVSFLHEKVWTKPAYAVLRQVRNATGFPGQVRTADALAVSLWPSRGISLTGVEVKVSRSDWLRELKQDKTAEIQKYCNSWFVVAPEKVIEPAEIPAHWGCIELNGSKRGYKTVKAAAALKPQPLSLGFIASILKNVYADDQRERGALRSEVEARVREEFAERLQKLQECEQVIRERDNLKDRLRHVEERRDHAEKSLAAIRDMGIDTYDLRTLGLVAQLMKEDRFRDSRMRSTFQSMIDAGEHAKLALAGLEEMQKVRA